MPRIVGVDIPKNKPVSIALRYIYGIGPANAVEILKKAEVAFDKRAGKLDESEISRITAVIQGDYAVEGDLRRIETQNIKRLMSINCYRGSRHKVGLPCRGQRTRTNARTRKGPKKTKKS